MRTLHTFENIRRGLQDRHSFQYTDTYLEPSFHVIEPSATRMALSLTSSPRETCSSTQEYNHQRLSAFPRAFHHAPLHPYTCSILTPNPQSQWAHLPTTPPTPTPPGANHHPSQHHPSTRATSPIPTTSPNSSCPVRAWRGRAFAKPAQPCSPSTSSFLSITPRATLPCRHCACERRQTAQP